MLLRMFLQCFSFNGSNDAAKCFYYEFIGLVKTNTNGCFKDNIKKMTTDWPVVYYLVLNINTMVPGGSWILAIGYKYSSWKVLFFISTEGSGRKKYGIYYLST